jgi:hypothetical protein
MTESGRHRTKHEAIAELSTVGVSDSAVFDSMVQIRTSGCAAFFKR